MYSFKRRLILVLLFLSISGFMIQAQPSNELYFQADLPLGNIAVTQNPNSPFHIFLTVHPESKPKYAKVFEIVNGIAIPFPDSSFQEKFISPLGIYLDLQNRLWVLDHGNYGFKGARLFAFDALSGELIFDYAFPKEIAHRWVMLNDLSVSPNGKYVFISAPGMFKKRSSIIVFDVVEKTSFRILTDHPTVMRRKLLPEVDGKKMRFLLGLYKVRPGVDGIDVDRQGKFLYYTAMADSSLYRIPVAVVTDRSLDDQQLSEQIQLVGRRPLCDGIRIDDTQTIYITDFQNHGILTMDEFGKTSSLFSEPRIRWADGLSVGSDGYLYITDSALQHVILKSNKKISKHKPFGIWRIRIRTAER